MLPLAVHAATQVDFPVKLGRTDSAATEIIATVHGLDIHGDELEEEVLLAGNSSAETEQLFLVVDDVHCSEGSVAFARRFGLGTATAEGCK